MMALSDKQAREIIVNKLNKNIFVIAGAGSGKTSILITRMVRMVEEGFDIKKFCTITFTVNAAAEFLARFRSILLKRSQQTEEQHKLEKNTLLPPPTDISRIRCANALKDVDLAFMGTIDSFCQKLVSEHPFEAKVPTSSTVVLEEDLISLYQKEFDNIVNKIAPYDDNKLQMLLSDFLKLHERPAEAFKASINEVLNASSFAIQYQPTYNHNVSFDTRYNQILKVYQEDLLSDLEELYRFGHSALNFPKELALYEKAQAAYDKFIKNQGLFLGPWKCSKIKIIASQIDKLTTNLIFSDDPELSFTKPLKTMVFKPHTSKDGQKTRYFKRDTKDEDYQIPTLFKQEIENLIYDYSLPFLVEAAKIIAQKFKKEGKLSFNQWLLCIKDVLEEDKQNNQGKLINHITNRYQYFMLDESQDTSPFQNIIFEILARQVPGKCTLFIVGDPKQSIYRFRGADAEAYLGAKNKFKAINSIKEVDKYDDIQIELLKNFRSSKEMRLYFNETFHSLDNYTPIEIADDEENNGFNSGAYGYDSEHLISIIQAMVNNSHYQTREGPNKTPRKLQYRDFMVITYSKGHQRGVVASLSEAHIPYNVEGYNVFSEFELIKAVYALYAYVANQNNATYYNLLTSSFIGLTPLECLMIHKESESVPLLKNKEYQINFVNELIKESRTFNPLTLYRRILENLSLFHAEEINKLDYLFFIEEKIKEALSGGSIASLKDGDMFLRDLLANKCERVSALSYKPNAVYVANLHKVKGLESPVVILIKSGAPKSAPTSRLDFMNKRSFLLKVGNTGFNANTFYLTAFSPLFNEQSELEKQALLSERDRLEYVAATRARDYLLIPNKSGVWKSLPVKQDFVILDREKEDIVEPLVRKLLVEHNLNVNFIDKANYRLVKPSTIDERFKFSKATDETPLEKDDQFEETEATVVGTIVHRLMEKLVLALPNKVEQKLIVETILNENNLENSISYKNILNEVYETIVLNGGYVQQKNNAPQDIYQTLSKARQIMCEVPFCYLSEQTMINGFIDLIYEDEKGYHIVDYKTDVVLGDHTAQLKEYIEALKVLFGVDADAKLYHIRIK